MSVGIGHSAKLEQALTLGLEIHSYLIGCSEGGLYRAVAVEANMIKAHRLKSAEYLFPRSHIGRHAAPLGKIIIDHGSTQINGVAVNEQPTINYPSLAHTKRKLLIIIGRTNAHAIDIGMELIPEAVLLRNAHLHLHMAVVDILIGKEDGGRILILVLNHNLNAVIAVVGRLTTKIEIDTH